MKTTDEIYESLAYDGARLLCVPLCTSTAFLVLAHCVQKKSKPIDTVQQKWQIKFCAIYPEQIVEIITNFC